MDEDGDYEVQSILQRHSGDVKFVIWHPDHELLLSGGYDNALRLYYYDGDDWVSAQDIEGAHGSTIWSGAFDSTGKYLVTVCAEHIVKVRRTFLSNLVLQNPRIFVDMGTNITYPNFISQTASTYVLRNKGYHLAIVFGELESGQQLDCHWRR